MLFATNMNGDDSVKQERPGIITVQRIGIHTYRSTLIFGLGSAEDGGICNFTLSAEEEISDGQFELYHKEERILSAARDAITARLEEIREINTRHKQIPSNERKRDKQISLMPPPSDDNN